MNLIWQIIAVPLGYIMQACYWFANDLLGLPGAAYIIAIFLFALVTKILMFPLSLKQQRSTARMSAFQPLMKELQDKYKNDKDKMNTEMQKLQQEYGISMFSGCLPMLLQFPILFGLVEVIYKPLTYMLHIPADVMAELSTVTARFLQVADPAADRLFETKIIEQLQTNSGMYTS
ncbi:MAG: YidC/Oxa1 family membrane protein insertase, partial [Oscillospiraceae bacterium]